MDATEAARNPHNVADKSLSGGSTEPELLGH
jgi:hypothetical protein